MNLGGAAAWARHPARRGTVLRGIARCAASLTARQRLRWLHIPTDQEHIMGKYFLAWLLGVPGLVLVLLWLFFH
jgi:hypothetical protein